MLTTPKLEKLYTLREALRRYIWDVEVSEEDAINVEALKSMRGRDIVGPKFLAHWKL